MKKQILKKSKSKFPTISRFITEYQRFLPRFEVRPQWQKYARYWAVTPAIALAIALCITSFDVYHAYTKKRTIDEQRSTVKQQIIYWEQIVAKYTDYRDGYFTLAVLEYQLGNKEKARDYLKKTLVLDPNFDEAKKFEAVLNK